MQTLWSRLATQTRLSCRCPSCVSGAHGVARRPITAAGKRPKYAYSSTLFYSGIFAAAATTDAVVKQKRREQWDEAIAQVKQEIGGQGWTSQENVQQDTEAQSLYSPLKERDVGPQAVFEDETYIPSGSIWPSNTGTPLIRHNLPPQSEYASKHKAELANNQLWSPKKLRTTELNVDRLVLRMLLYLDDIGELTSAASDLPVHFQEFMRTPRARLEELEGSVQSAMGHVGTLDGQLTTYDAQSDTIKSCTHKSSARYFQDPEGSHMRTADDLLQATKALFHPDQANTFPSMIAKLCYNLSISSVPPTLPIWNCILDNLVNLSKDAAPANYVISCICHSHVRMNEDTLVSMLDHCRIHDRVDEFTKTVGRLRGEFGGLMLARQDINITERGGASRLVRVSEDKVIQNPYPTPKVFEALIKGVLHFAGFEAALAICQDMGHEGWGLSIRGLVPLLSDCVGRSDWESGQAVWRQMNLIKLKSRRDGRAERLPQAAYVEMARMCLDQADEEMFDDIVQLAKIDRHNTTELVQSIVQSMGALRTSAAEDVQPAETRKKEVASPPSTIAEDSFRKDAQRDTPRVVDREHLIGDLAATTELEDYETGERPMELLSWHAAAR